MILEGLNLALFGMGTVFIFLALLILVTKFMSYLLRGSETVQLASADSHVANLKQNQPSSSVAKHHEMNELRLVLAAAIKEFKAKN